MFHTYLAKKSLTLPMRMASRLHLPANSNQALGIGEYAIDFVNSKKPISEEVRIKPKRSR
jgi:copper(I)-binding protein